MKQFKGILKLGNVTVSGYQIHAGESTGPALARPLMELDGNNDGVISEDQQIIGSYLHGLFEEPAACQALLSWAGLKQVEASNYHALREAGIDRIADSLEQCVDVEELMRLLSA